MFGLSKSNKTDHVLDQILPSQLTDYWIDCFSEIIPIQFLIVLMGDFVDFYNWCIETTIDH